MSPLPFVIEIEVELRLVVFHSSLFRMNGVGVFSILSSLQATINRHVIKRTELISLFISAQFPIGSVGLLNLQIEKREPTMLACK